MMAVLLLYAYCVGIPVNPNRAAEEDANNAIHARIYRNQEFATSQRTGLSNAPLHPRRLLVDSEISSLACADDLNDPVAIKPSSHCGDRQPMPD